MTKVDLTREEMEKLERIRNPRDTTLSQKFSRKDVERWRKAADDAGLSMTEWMENCMNSGTKK